MAPELRAKIVAVQGDAAEATSQQAARQGLAAAVGGALQGATSECCQ